VDSQLFKAKKFYCNLRRKRKEKIKRNAGSVILIDQNEIAQRKKIERIFKKKSEKR